MKKKGFWRRLSRPLRISDEKGQVSIFIGSMLLTFFLFLTFVLNTGMLVNAKINLQNAADLAAYAGAAVQARQLNDIGYLNYEMRRTYKKFLYRYYVLGNVNLPTFPKNANAGGAARFGVTEFNSGQASRPVDLGVPSTCVTFLPNENFCGMAKLPSLPTVGGGINNLDAIMGALKEKFDQIESIRKAGCVGIGQMNQQLMLYWLWNTDPSLDAVATALAGAGGDANYVARLRVLRSLAAGLGLMPREIFLRKRIDTLNRYVNFAPQTAVDLRATNALKGGSDWAMHERTIQAYLSAYHTLGNNTFADATEIRMDEILPGSSSGANLLALTDIKTRFDAFATDFSVGATCSSTGVSDPVTAARNDDCTQCLVSFPQSQDLGGFDPIVGVAKDPTVMTYYAIRLSAKAKILFSPWGDLTLTAYAAAQPFGSRIGPPLAEAIYSTPGAPAIMNRCTVGTCVGMIPNMPMKEGDSPNPTRDSGWGQNDVLYHLYRGGLIPTGTGSVSQTITNQDLSRAYHVAMAPNPWEMGRYNIPNDSNEDPFLESFDAKGVRAIWAPLFTGSSTAANANPAAEIIDYINRMASGYTTQTTAAKSIFSPAAQAALITQINAYVNGFLRDGRGEDGEGLNVIRIFDPISTRTDLSGNRLPLAPAIPDTIHMRDPKRLKTGWNDVLSRTPPYDYQQRGRTGYSVKFVPLNLLRTASGVTTNAIDSFQNRLPATGGVGPDIVEMKH